MKRILCLIDNLGMGGAERQMIGLARCLKEQGCYVDLVTYHHRNSYAELVKHYGIENFTLDVGTSKWSKFNAVRRYIKTSGGYDSVIAYKDGPAIISCLLKLFGGDFTLIVSERNTNQQISKHDRLKFFLYRFADYVVPNSFSQERFIKQHFPVLAKKVVTITNYTDTNCFVPLERLENKNIIILTVARIAKQKNVLNYLQAIRRLKEMGVKVQFEWFGNVQKGEEKYGEEVKEMRQSLGLEEMISFHQSTTDIVSQYQLCDVFCLPSIFEGFPNVICEAMSCGKPIVCSRVCDNPNIVQENVNGLLFDPTNVSDMVQKIHEIITMPTSTLHNFGNESRKRAVDLFSYESFVKKYIELI